MPVAAGQPPCCRAFCRVPTRARVGADWTSAMALTLYTYFRSSAAYRVRIALQLKGIDAEYAFVDLRRDGGDQKKPEYVARNPQRLIPLLVEDDFVLNQSLAIL